MPTVMIQTLQPGQRFALYCDPDVKGTVLRKSDCSVTVKVSGGIKDVEFEDPKTGEKRSFRAEGGRTTNWSPNTEVIAGEVGSVEDEEPTIRPRRGKTADSGPAQAAPRADAPTPGSEAQSTPAAPRAIFGTPYASQLFEDEPARPPEPAVSRNAEPRKPGRTTTRTPKPPKETKMSALDAAEKVLGGATKPLTAKELVDIMAAKGYWSSPGGKTPHATLNSAIMREIKEKGDGSRFAKHPDGGFTLSIL